MRQPEAISIETGSAITLVNAMIPGKGAAIGTKLINKVTIERSRGIQISVPTDVKSTRLIEVCLEEFTTTSGVEIDNIKITTSSILPPAKGLKTSSSIACGTLEVLNQYFKQSLPVDKIVNMSADASITAEVSVTGAIDDAWASFVGGMFLTDNLNRVVLQTDEIRSKSKILFLVPEYSNPKGKMEFPDDVIDEYLLNQAIERVIRGEYEKAIEINSKVYGQYLLKDPLILDELHELTGKVVGLNGGGPALFVIVGTDNSEIIIQKIKQNFSRFKIIPTEYRV